MRRLRAGTLVPGGHYLSLSKWCVSTIEGDEGLLVGDAHETFLQLPSLVVSAGRPLVCGLFFLGLPVVALGVVAGAVLRTGGDLVRTAQGEPLPPPHAWPALAPRAAGPLPEIPPAEVAAAALRAGRDGVRARA